MENMNNNVQNEQNNFVPNEENNLQSDVFVSDSKLTNNSDNGNNKGKNTALIIVIAIAVVFALIIAGLVIAITSLSADKDDDNVIVETGNRGDKEGSSNIKNMIIKWGEELQESENSYANISMLTDEGTIRVEFQSYGNDDSYMILEIEAEGTKIKSSELCIDGKATSVSFGVETEGECSEENYAETMLESFDDFLNSLDDVDWEKLEYVVKTDDEFLIDFMDQDIGSELFSYLDTESMTEGVLGGKISEFTLGLKDNTLTIKIGTDANSGISIAMSPDIIIPLKEAKNK